MHMMYIEVKQKLNILAVKSIQRIIYIGFFPVNRAKVSIR